MADSTQDENKVDIGETSVNLNYVKNEPDEVIKFEENLYITQYRVTLEYDNIFGGFSHNRYLDKYDDNLIGFLNNDPIMENMVIKLEGIKGQGGNFNYCNSCNGDYKGYCLRCSSLSHILNNTAQLIYSKSEISTTPTDVIEIRDSSVGKGVFLLRTLPENIIFGPFEGISAIESTKGFGWKMNDKRLANVGNGNWMKDIACTANASIRNLDILQMKENLYFQSNREIMEGEELLVYYNDEEIQMSDDNKECYFIPRKQEKLPKIFACTQCCLGFSLIKCLIEHKSKCLYMEEITDVKDFELVECHCCKIWMEKQEYQEYHMGYCWEKYHRMLDNHSQPVDRSVVYEEEEVEERVNTKATCGKFKCSQCSFQTDYKKDSEKHLKAHKKPIQCDICMKNFISKRNLKNHVKNKHTGDGSTKDYQCSECSFKTNYKHAYKIHSQRHSGIKPFECGICKMKFTQKINLERHIKNKHTENGSAKDYQCSECSYKTNDKRSFQSHLNRHRGVKPFECGICMMKFSGKMCLNNHIKNIHAENGNAKDYQCSECSFKTSYKYYYQIHLERHSGIKPFECGICMMKFCSKFNLKSHVKNKHVENGSANGYQCSKCSFHTKYKHSLQSHLNGHTGIKAFECDICMTKFSWKVTLDRHIKNKHAKNGSAKDYQCSECSYATNCKRSFQNHVNGHRDVKPFECGICKMQFSSSASLNIHIKNKHTENGTAKHYQCSECSYATNYKSDYQTHLNVHRGIKPFVCGICQMTFSWKNVLKSHMKNKHTQKGCAKDHQCSECSYGTNCKRSFQNHLNGHRGVKPFECGTCKTKFTTKSGLKTHIKKKHVKNGI